MRIPLATYRLQFNGRFRFRDALGIVPYLDALGISDLYASPLLQARAGSTHGYDVTDPTRLNRELGSERDFEHLTRELRRRGIGLLLDIVPNHMAASGENRWWMDVLENGGASPFSAFFDIDWHPSKKALLGEGAPAGARRALREDPGEPGAHAAPGEGRLLRALLRDQAPALPALVRPHPGAPDRVARGDLRGRAPRLPGVLGAHPRHRAPALHRAPRTRPDARAGGGPGAGQAGALGPLPPPRRRSAPSSRRTSGSSTAARASRRASASSTGSSRSRPTGSRTGGSPTRRSTTGGFSRSATWSACGSRTPASSTPRTPWSCGWRGKGR